MTTVSTFPESDEEYHFFRALIENIGPQAFGEMADFLIRFLELRFSDTPIGRLLQFFLESLKAAHRTRADGWGAWCVAKSLIRSARDD